MKTKKWILGIVILCVLGMGAYFFFGSSAPKSMAWETVAVSRNNISNVVTATGTVEPISQVEVGTQVSGIINRIYVDYNSIVKKGDLIAELDRVVLESELKSKQADLASSRTEYEYQQKNYVRIKTLHEKQLVSDTEYETAVYQYEKAKNTYEKNQSDLVKVKTNLSYAMIYSPIDGVVLSRAVEEGQTVAASFNTPTLFTIANDLTKMRVIADVDEADIGQVKEGQKVTFSVDAYPEDVFRGEVTQVRLEATTTSNVVTYEVVVNAPNPDLKLKPGLTANITIYTMEKNNILTVPAKALRFTPEVVAKGTKLSPLEGKKAFTKSVWLKEGDVLREVAIKSGMSTTALTEVLEGVKEGDQVVTGVAMPAAMQLPANGQGEQSPFMPQRPGAKKK